MGDPLETRKSEKLSERQKKLKGGPSALCLRWPELASVVLVVSVESGPLSVGSVI